MTDYRGYGPHDPYQRPSVPMHDLNWSASPRQSPDFQSTRRFGTPSTEHSRTRIRLVSNISPGTSRHRVAARDPPELRNVNPGIDVALRNLRQETCISMNMFHDLVRSFEKQTLPLSEWVGGATLDMAWRDKVESSLRSDNERAQFTGAATRISDCRRVVKDATSKGKSIVSTWDEKDKIECQIRTAKKAVVYCDGVIELAGRAVHERLACRHLVQELKEIMNLLSKKRHPWICKLGSTTSDQGNALSADELRARWRRRTGRRRRSNRATQLSKQRQGQDARVSRI